MTKATTAAQQVSDLLNAATTARVTVVRATAGLANCSLDTATAVSQLSGVVALRQSLLGRSSTAPFADLPAGPKLQALLTQAWTASLAADQSFLAWSQDELSAGSCDPNSSSSNRNFSAANVTSAQATAAKKAFSSLWNASVSGPLGVPARSETDF